MQIGPLSFLPSGSWSLCMSTARLAVTIKAGSEGQLARADKDKKLRRRAEEGCLKMCVCVWKRALLNNRKMWVSLFMTCFGRRVFFRQTSHILCSSTNICRTPVHTPTRKVFHSEGCCRHPSSPFTVASNLLTLNNKDGQQHSHPKCTHTTLLTDHCLPFWYSLHWRASRWDAFGVAPSVGDSVSDLDSKQCCAGELNQCRGSGPGGVALYFCVRVSVVVLRKFSFTSTSI